MRASVGGHLQCDLSTPAAYPGCREGKGRSRQHLACSGQSAEPSSLPPLPDRPTSCTLRALISFRPRTTPVPAFEGVASHLSIRDDVDRHEDEETRWSVRDLALSPCAARRHMRALWRACGAATKSCSHACLARPCVIVGRWRRSRSRGQCGACDMQHGRVMQTTCLHRLYRNVCATPSRDAPLCFRSHDNFGEFSSRLRATGLSVRCCGARRCWAACMHRSSACSPVYVSTPSRRAP